MACHGIHVISFFRSHRYVTMKKTIRTTNDEKSSKKCFGRTVIFKDLRIFLIFIMEKVYQCGLFYLFIDTDK